MLSIRHSLSPAIDASREQMSASIHRSNSWKTTHWSSSLAELEAFKKEVESKCRMCVSRQAVRRKHMEDVAAAKVAFQERTHANAVTFHYSPAVSPQPLTVRLPPSVSVPYLVSGHCNKLAGCGWWLTPPSWPNFSVSQQTETHSHTCMSQL